MPIGAPISPGPIYWRTEHKKIEKNVRILNRPGGGSFGAPIIDEKKFI